MVRIVIEKQERGPGLLIVISIVELVLTMLQVLLVAWVLSYSNLGDRAARSLGIEIGCPPAASSQSEAEPK